MAMALARTDRAVGDLEAQVTEELRHSGWDRLDSGFNDVFAWSSWQLPGKGNWRGLLLVLAALGHDQRSLSLHIESGESTADGWHRQWICSGADAKRPVGRTSVAVVEPHLPEHGPGDWIVRVVPAGQ
jgi:hypothetical protein